MKKLTLDLDALRVDSFDTAAAGAERRGTVRGNATTEAFVGAYPASELDTACPAPGSDAASCQSCLTCRVATDPCICDPVPQY